MSDKYRVGITRDILDSSGSPAFGETALDILRNAKHVEWEYLPELVSIITPDHAAHYDAIYVNHPRVPDTAVAREDCRLRVVARHGMPRVVGVDAQGSGRAMSRRAARRRGASAPGSGPG